VNGERAIDDGSLVGVSTEVQALDTAGDCVPQGGKRLASTRLTGENMQLSTPERDTGLVNKR